MISFYRRTILSANHRASGWSLLQIVFDSSALGLRPGYRANDDTHRAWAQHGIRVAQNGPGTYARHISMVTDPASIPHCRF